MNEKINILNIELYQTSAKAAMQKVVQYMESDSINTVEIITMDMLLKGKDMPGWKEAVESTESGAAGRDGDSGGGRSQRKDAAA